ncbi:tripartite motif-containing protein 16 [Amia ocellicauda]|uniref:tripartite motif-containing protein 16 n=1 Tax=Amia ocellicauda TaxID=2972642 RepID=UPI003464BBC0
MYRLRAAWSKSTLRKRNKRRASPNVQDGELPNGENGNAPEALLVPPEMEEPVEIQVAKAAGENTRTIPAETRAEREGAEDTESLKSSAQTAVQDSERIFTELICSIERRRCEVTQMIRAQERAAVSQAEGLIEKLEQEIAELRTKDTDLKKLSLTKDHIHFLQNCHSICAPPGAADSPNITVSPLFSLEAVGKAVTELKERLEDVCKGELVKISQTVKRVSSLQDPEPRTRAEFLQSLAYCFAAATAPAQFLLSSCAAVQTF